jgi:hypothetical protein
MEFNAPRRNDVRLIDVRKRQFDRRVPMTREFVTKILSLAAAVTLVTLCALVAVPKNAGGKLGPQHHAAALR